MLTNQTMTLAQAHHLGFELVQLHSARFGVLVRGLAASELNAPVPAGDWTVGETVTHVQSVYERYTTDLRRAATPDEVATQNQDDIDRLGVDPGASAASIQQQVELMAIAMREIEPDQTFPFHAGLDTTMAGAWGNLLGELHAHGDDIARATGQNFTLPSADLEILWRFTAPLLTGWLADNADGADESWDLRFDFGTIRLTITNGALHHGTEHDPRPDHHHIVIDDTATWTLAVPYQRRPITDPEHAVLARRFRPL